MCDGALLDYIILDTEPIAAPVRQNVRPPFTITITISYGEKHGPVKVRRAHLISVLLFVKGMKNTPKQYKLNVKTSTSQLRFVYKQTPPPSGETLHKYQSAG